MGYMDRQKLIQFKFYKFQKMSQDALQYLQRDDIGKVIAKGLASLYTKKPQRPVKYLAQWLRSYSSTKKQLSTVLMQQNSKKDFLTIFEQSARVENMRQHQEQIKQKQFMDRIQDFKNMVARHQYQEELLLEILPEFVEQATKITGAYIGELNHPFKDITEEDTEDNAHLNMAADKVINYIGSSLSHAGLMRAKMLKLDQGITSKVFSMSEQQSAPPAAGEQGEQQPKQKSTKQKYLYVPNVVKNQSMHYFKIPKLGAYLAIPFICKSYLDQRIFDQVLIERKRQIQENDDFNKKKTEELEEMNNAKQDLLKRVNDLKEKHADEAQIQHLQTELVEQEKKIADKTTEVYEETELIPNYNKKSYVFCVDNLGQDEELDPKDIELIMSLVEHFKQSWEDKEKHLLFEDIKTQIDYLREMPASPQAIKAELQKTNELDEETSKQFSQIEDQFLRAYKIEQHEYTHLKQHITSTQIFLSSFLLLKNFRIIKYKKILQNILYMLGESKESINVANRASLDWKNVKNTHINKEVFFQILNFVVHGPKDKSFKFYAKTASLLQIFSKFSEDEVFMYNVGLGALLNFIKKALKHRISNVKLRKAQREAERKERETLIEQNLKIDALKEQQLKIHKDNLPAEEVQGFKQEDWIEKFDKEHPKHQVPGEVVDDIDNDM